MALEDVEHIPEPLVLCNVNCSIQGVRETNAAATVDGKLHGKKRARVWGNHGRDGEEVAGEEDLGEQNPRGPEGKYWRPRGETWGV